IYKNITGSKGREKSAQSEEETTEEIMKALDEDQETQAKARKSKADFLEKTYLVLKNYFTNPNWKT
ncbi:hypothetical protein CYY_004525, partial [Polysphondylium violaceum]